ncbi:Holliday junction branch migration protein RuvA [Microaceticoccus formicicus]|uniref:Holliday junction branch migration protein RuvA n=1 Tax=Microaceticoccus formicicus TaxID=3118105 RepID=UPI003CD0060E|nr:Holliday junction branch migration protein RuvA [Peptoniphilaceae bacterium AMB_02]
MLDYIIGDIKRIGEDYIVLDNNGIGYLINTSSYSISNFTLYETYLVHTHMVVREDAILLYGFYDDEELEMFKLLTTVSSIGPKIGLGILSSLSVSTISKAIRTNDINILTKAPGVGKKTASRIILELSDKIAKMNFKEDAETVEITKMDDEIESAVEALTNLGYIRSDVLKIIRSLNTENMGIEEIIKQCIIRLAR